MPRMLLEHNGVMSLEINEYEPRVASGDPLLPTPTSMIIEGHASGLNYGNQKYHQAIECVLDDEFRVILEHNEVKVDDRKRVTVVERAWDGTDYEEQTTVDDDEPVKGYRRTIDDNTFEVLFRGQLFSVSRREHEQGSYVWATTSDDGLEIVTRTDENGHLAYQFRTTTEHQPRRTKRYEYGEDGNLQRIITTPGSISYGENNEPEDHHEVFIRQDDQLLIVKSLPFPDSPGNPERSERRHYGRSGEYQGSELIDGFPDVGRFTLKHTVRYDLDA